MAKNDHSSVYRGIYEFEDPAGTLVAAKIPHHGTADLYAGTAVIVRPNQCALFIYKGKLADVFVEGTHELQTENVPLLTRLANWKFGFKSPLRAELWFFSSQAFTARRWGTSKPVFQTFEGIGSVPIRSFGNYNIRLSDPKKFYLTLIGNKNNYDITELEDFVQGQLVENFPEALSIVKSIESINKSQDEVSKKLQIISNRVLAKYGLEIVDLQVLSILPSTEILEAMDAKAAMQIIGNKQEYLLYRAANSLKELNSSEGNNTANDPMQMMLGMMLGKGLMGSDFREKEREVSSRMIPSGEINSKQKFCSSCGSPMKSSDRFCSSCGKAAQ